MYVYSFQEIFMLNSLKAGEPRSRVMTPRCDIYFNNPITIKISPQHYSSTIKIEFSYIDNHPSPYDYSESITIHEKLVLKQL